MGKIGVGALYVMVALAAMGGRAWGQGSPATQLTPEQVDAAIAKGVAYIIGLQKDNGMFGDFDPRNPGKYKYPGDAEVTAMTVLAYAEHDLRKPEMQKGLKALAELDLSHTYTLGFRLIACAEIYRHADDKMKLLLRRLMKADADELVSYQFANGAWHYGASEKPQFWDFSNTQIAVLGLQQAVLSGVEVDAAVFQKVQNLYLEKQHDDGGWDYYGREDWKMESYGSMTAAAVASLMITRDLLDPGSGCPCKGEKSRGTRNPKVDEAVARGVKWLGEQFVTTSNPQGSWASKLVPYWLYACERVGIATGFKYLGRHNWYAEGAAQLLKEQKSDGSWGGGEPADTMFPLLFLIKGRGPILLNKLQHSGEWDRHAADAANLSSYVSEIKEQPIQWQVINLTVPVAEWHDAPILYVTTESPIKLTDEDKKRLRQFTDTGGTILFEASCGNQAVGTWWVRTCGEIWPEWELKGVDKEHPLWTADQKIMGRLPAFQGISDGLRTCVFYSPRDMSCVWTTKAVTQNRPLFDLGCNLYAYTTDRGKLRARLGQSAVADKYAGQRPAKGAKAALTVARIKHGGDWYVGRNYHPWAVLGERLQAQAGLAISEGEPLAPGDAAAADVLYLSGRATCSLTDDGVKWLKERLDGGALLVAEAVLGDKRFDGEFRVMIDRAGLALRPLDKEHPLLSGALGAEAKGYAVPQVGYAVALKAERIGKPLPLLLGIYHGEKMVGVYSPFDVMYRQTGAAAFDCRGYDVDDARALAANIALLASGR